MDTLSRAQVNAMIRDEQAGRSIRALASEWGISAAYLSDVLLGRREVGPKILVHLGLKRKRNVEITYVMNGRRKRKDGAR